MKKLLLASVLAIASFPGYAHAGEADCDNNPKSKACSEWRKTCPDGCTTHSEDAAHPECEGEADYVRCVTADNDEPTKPPARVTVAPPYQGPPPIGWVYKPYTSCPFWPQCSTVFVTVQADGLNVRTVPNGPPVMALVNGTPIIPIRFEGNWVLIAAGCDLTPTFAWSWTAGVPLNRCWVYF